MNTFSIFYALICIQLRSILFNFTELMNPSSEPDYFRMHKFFNVIRAVVIRTDKQLCFFYFLNVFYNASMMYFVITMFLKPEMHPHAVQQSTIYIISINGFSSFLIITILASTIHEMFLNISDKADIVVKENRKTIAAQTAQIRFMKSTGKETALTAWHIVRIKRNMILAVFGTLLTYCILLYNVTHAP